MSARLVRVGFGALAVLALGACFADRLTAKRCDETHACIDGWACIDEVCVFGDGGVLDDAGVDGGGTDAGESDAGDGDAGSDDVGMGDGGALFDGGLPPMG